MKWRALGVTVLFWPILWPTVARAEEPAAGDGLTPFPAAATTPASELKKDPVPFSWRTVTGWKDLGAKIDVGGYLQPTFQLVSIDSAVPRDKTQYGARGTRAGFVAYGTPLEKFTYVAHIVIAPAGVEDIALLSPTASSNIGFSLPTGASTAVYVEEASLSYHAAESVLLKAGLMHLPFSLGQTTPIPEQMLPFRPPQTGEFQSGDDAALLATYRPFDAKLTINAGAFLGTSFGSPDPNQTVRGPSLLGGVTAQPLGEMSTQEGDPNRGPLRLAFGVAATYRRATSFDLTGYEASKFDDVRFTGWARIAAHGFYAQAEYLRRNRTDDLSGRPDKSEAYYAAASYFQPVGKIGIGPVIRAGSIKTSADFDPRRFTSFEAGLAFYPRATEDEPERLRLVVEYFYAHVSPLDETQHEGVVQLQLEF